MKLTKIKTPQTTQSVKESTEGITSVEELHMLGMGMEDTPDSHEQMRILKMSDPETYQRILNLH